MSLDFWQELEGTVIDDKVRLEALKPGEAPVFRARFTDQPDGEAVMVRFWPENPAAGSIVDRHLEATFFYHPNLLRCLGTGTVQLRDEPFVYGLYEDPDASLADLLRQGPIAPEAVQVLGKEIIAGLSYLHGLSLIYCNLDPASVARRGDCWKLTDYSQIRIEGPGYATETRRLLAAVASTPPEAFQGWVSPAWDAWGLAHLMRAALMGPRQSREKGGDQVLGRGRFQDLPEPFATLTSACLVADPQERCSLEDIAEQLELPITEHVGSAPVEEEADVKAEAEIEAEPVIKLPLEPEAEDDYAPPFPARSVGRREEHGFGPRTIAAGIGVAGFVIVALLIATQMTRNPQTDNAATPTAEVPASNPATSRSRQAAAASPEEQVAQVLTNWASTFQKHDLEQHLTLYAPKLSRFYRQHNASLQSVRHTKEDVLSKAGEIRKYDLSDVKTRFPKPDEAVVTFDKTWQFAGGRNASGKVQGELRLEKNNGKWLIVSERDVKVYRRS